MLVHEATKELKGVANSRSGKTLKSREKQKSRMLREGGKEGRKEGRKDN